MEQPHRLGEQDFTPSAEADVTVEAKTGGGWPPLGWERLEWETRIGAGPRTMTENPFVPYKAAVPPFIASIRYTPSGEVTAAVEDAALAIRDFDHDFGGDVAPFSAILLRTESVSSSQIENVTANARSIGMAELGDDSKRNATLVVDNVAAMNAALAAADSLETVTVLEMHRALMRHADPRGAGRFREEPVWIGTSSLSPAGADFVAPDSRRVPELMDDLMDYVGRNDVQILAQSAIAHAQFETIHPFTDGNGRTGRALLHAMLRNKGLTRTVTVPVSAGLLNDVSGYHDALTAYRKGEPDAIILLTAEATFRAINNGRQLAGDITAARERWKEAIKARKDAAAWTIADLLARQPVVNAELLEERLGISPATIWRQMQVLEEAGVVQGFDKFKRGRHWRSDEILAALDSFADRSGRRVRS
ncbi:Fic family protein [Pseudarthrobacter sulfonivorans]|uniref:Fic family protein n=1 Tax=Pseudarthrobacter sulfonivorans TaxID=121292 RepID=UPI000ADF1E78|nr:Fic family protein [Pseudarthrobacter sulfonivorans]